MASSSLALLSLSSKSFSNLLMMLFLILTSSVDLLTSPSSTLTLETSSWFRPSYLLSFPTRSPTSASRETIELPIGTSSMMLLLMVEIITLCRSSVISS